MSGYSMKTEPPPPHTSTELYMKQLNNKREYPQSGECVKERSFDVTWCLDQSEAGFHQPWIIASYPRLGVY